ncbi:MAG: phage integrase SAM-like domain-containing protein [Holosporaceae bacterium]|nr:phage integrase SAM-like domain-containing protein [Holosporaceae bacterium]
MATFKAVVLAHHKKSDGTYNVKIRITHNRIVRYMKTNIFVDKKELTKSMKIKDEGINYEIEGIVRKYRHKCNLLGKRIDNMSVEQIIEHLENDKPFSLDFIKFGRENAERLRKEGREGTARNHDVALNVLSEFIKKDTLDISEITSKFLKKFVKWLDERQPETKRVKGQRAPSLYTSIIRAIHNTAKEEYNDEDTGIINIPLSPFAKFKVPHEPATRKRALPVNVIQSIIDLPYEPDRIGGKWSRFNRVTDSLRLQPLPSLPQIRDMPLSGL